MSERNDDLKNALLGNLGYIAVVVLCAAFVLSAMISPVGGNKTFREILSSSAMTFVLGLAIDRILKMQGRMNGFRSRVYAATMAAFAEAVARIDPFRDKLDGWCAMRHDECLRDARRQILRTYGMRYEDYFETDAPALLTREGLSRKEYRARKRALKRARRVKITYLYGSMLTSGGRAAKDPLDIGHGLAMHDLIENVRTVLSKCATVLIFGYYTYDVIISGNVGKIIWYLMEVAFLVTLGVIRMNKEYLFITDTYRQRTVRKIGLLQNFENWARTCA